MPIWRHTDDVILTVAVFAMVLLLVCSIMKLRDRKTYLGEERDIKIYWGWAFLIAAVAAYLRLILELGITGG